MSKQGLLIIDKAPFGCLTDSYKWCQYLRDDYDITFICLDSTEREKLVMDGVDVRYVSSRGSRTMRGVRYMLYVLWFLLFYRGKIMVVYFPGVDVFKRIFFWKKMNLDIRTLSVYDDEVRNRQYDAKLRKTCDLYEHITLISEGIRDKLGLDISKTSILPLGSDVISQAPKQFNSLNLLYVGTFTNRNLDVTLKGLAKYIDETGERTIHYHIVGDGEGDILARMKKIAYDELVLNDNVTFYGRVAHHQLTPFFDKCNVGVSFVPMTEYYEYQPPTKTYEYVLSGLYCIATATHSNKQLIDSRNGVLIKDDENSFANALIEIYNNRENIKEQEIRESLKDSTWENIVKNILKPILKFI
jgi:glycosyltransferase involved in cell wall biosynthesis